MTTIVKVGQIWRDNYNYQRALVRYVKILSVPHSGFSRVTIKRCKMNGAPMPGSPTVRTEIERFHKGGKSGFTLVKEAG